MADAKRPPYQVAQGTVAASREEMQATFMLSSFFFKQTEKLYVYFKETIQLIYFHT